MVEKAFCVIDKQLHVAWPNRLALYSAAVTENIKVLKREQYCSPKDAIAVEGALMFQFDIDAPSRAQMRISPK